MDKLFLHKKRTRPVNKIWQNLITYDGEMAVYWPDNVWGKY